MANVVTTISITHDPNVAVGSLGLKDSSDPKGEARRLSHLFKRFTAGLANGKFQVNVDASVAKASGTLTCASVSDADTCVIGGVTLTAKTSPSGQSQWLRGVSDSADAAALVACVNAHTSLAGMVTASNLAGVVTVSAFASGAIGNGISLVGTATRMAASAANLAGGSGIIVAPVVYNLGV